MSSTPVVLVIAALDSSGGAGLTRDAQTLEAFDVGVCCAATALTVQTDREVLAVQPVEPPLLRAQLQAASRNAGLAAIKIGLLGSASAIDVVAEWLPAFARLPIVLDPVLVASSGGVLLDERGRQALITRLLPHISLLTPNLPEAATLLGCAPARGTAECRDQLRQLRALGCPAVLLKGGHAEGEGAEAIITDWLAVDEQEPVALATPRIPAQVRGSGCSAASAIAAQLAWGVPLVEACRGAQNYVATRLQRAAAQATVVSAGNSAGASWRDAALRNLAPEHRPNPVGSQPGDV